MKKLVLLTAILMIVSITAFAQTNEWVQLCPVSAYKTNAELLDGAGNHIGAQWGNSVTHITAFMDVSSADSIQLAFDCPDSVKVDSIRYTYAMRTAGTVDTLSTVDGATFKYATTGFTSTEPTGYLKFYTGLSSGTRMRTLPKWLKLYIYFASTGNHYTNGTLGAYTRGTERFKTYVKLFK